MKTLVEDLDTDREYHSLSNGEQSGNQPDSDKESENSSNNIEEVDNALIHGLSCDNYESEGLEYKIDNILTIDSADNL